MKIIQNFVTKNRCYTNGRKITVRGLMLHSVGCPQPAAAVFAKTWDNPSCSVCTHGIIDGNTGDVYQLLPWDYRAWHCGAGANGSGNDTHIGIEMGEPASIQYISGSAFKCADLTSARKTVKRTYKSAVKLFSKLCKKYKLNPLEDGVIISHSEGCARRIASNHGDPEHLWRGLGLSYTMDKFRKAVSKQMEEDKKNEPPEWAKKTGKLNYTVKITADELNIRKLPGTFYAITGTVRKGEVYTIVAEEKAGGDTWGKLKSGKGYICLKYAKKIEE